jgi:hypothetical protein
MLVVDAGRECRCDAHEWHGERLARFDLLVRGRGGVALLVVRIVNYLERTMSMTEAVDAENVPHDEPQEVGPAGDIAMTPAFASATDGRETVGKARISVDAVTEIRECAQWRCVRGECL